MQLLGILLWGFVQAYRFAFYYDGEKELKNQRSLASIAMMRRLKRIYWSSLFDTDEIGVIEHLTMRARGIWLKLN